MYLLDHFENFVVLGPEGRVAAKHDVVDHATGPDVHLKKNRKKKKNNSEPNSMM